MSTPAQDLATQDESTLLQARDWLGKTVQQQNARSTELRMEVQLGQLDPRLKLAPCQIIEPYVPMGTSLWGRSRVGLRCIQGPVRWNVFVPVTVRAWGQAWVLTRNIPSGARLLESDAVQAEVDWAEEPSAVVARQESWIGQVATRSLQSGQPLRQSMVKAPEAFVAGAQVRVVATGQGFQIATDGQALSPGVVGQLARVRVEGGRVMPGTVVDKNTVQLQM